VSELRFVRRKEKFLASKEVGTALPRKKGWMKNSREGQQQAYNPRVDHPQLVILQ
jgi:hypothetical protein